MDGDQRRQEIKAMLDQAKEPLSGGRLGKKFKVSRQVIVQDVALLRATGLDIIATARGYMLYKNPNQNKQRVVFLQHDFEDIGNELNTIVDFGGIIRNVIIEHPIYGEMVGNMMVETRRDVEKFVRDIEEEATYPLMKLTNGVHMHTIEASSERILDDIELALDKKGYLYHGDEIK